MTSFVRPWGNVLPRSENAAVPVPLIDFFLRGNDGSAIREFFIVDSGADMSMAPRELCERLDRNWESGEPTTVFGISPSPECAVAARIHEVDIFIPEIQFSTTIPICFAEGESPQLLGREGFFTRFRIAFDQPRGETSFERAPDQFP